MSVGLDIQEILLFFIFVAPGFFFTRTYLLYRPRYYQETSALEQTALALVGSAIIHGTLLSAIATGILIAWSITGHTFTTSQLLGADVPVSEYPLHILAFYLFVTSIYLLLAIVIARRTGIFFGKRTPEADPKSWRWLTRIIGEYPPENLFMWYIILRQEALQKGLLAPKVTVRMRNGDTFEGRLNRLKLVGDEDNTIEIALTEAVCHPAGDSAGADISLEDQILLLQSTDILWLSRENA